MYGILRGLRSRLPHPLNCRTIPPVPFRVHVADSMLPNTDWRSVASYAQAGESGLEAMGEALERTGKSWSDIGSALDLGCGYGRVLRYLCGVLRPESITACDLDARAVAFCSAELGVKPLVSQTDLSRVPFETYDFVWSGSLLTHLPPKSGDRFVALLSRILNPGGVALVSFHGDHSLERLADLYGGDHADEAESIRQEVRSTGTAYRPYGGRFSSYEEADYGMAWHQPSFLRRRCEELNGDAVKWVGHLPRGWDDHHDLAVLQKS